MAEVSAPILSVGKWEVREMTLTVEKMQSMWTTLQRYQTLFSDFTRGDYDAWVAFVLSPTTYWLEVWELDKTVGVIYFEGIHAPIDVQLHMMFFDRAPAEKAPLVREVVKYMFSHFPIQRITVMVPRIYHATLRLSEKLGFRREGTKREAVLLGGRWVDIVICGLLRKEVQWDS